MVGCYGQGGGSFGCIKKTREGDQCCSSLAYYEYERHGHIFFGPRKKAPSQRCIVADTEQPHGYRLGFNIASLWIIRSKRPPPTTACASTQQHCQLPATALGPNIEHRPVSIASHPHFLCATNTFKVITATAMSLFHYQTFRFLRMP